MTLLDAVCLLYWVLVCCAVVSTLFFVSTSLLLLCVGVNLRSGEMFWTINGLALPTGFEQVVPPNADAYELSDPAYPELFACVGMQDAGQQVTFNFGKTRFAFKDIDPHYVPTKKAKKTKKKKSDDEEGPCSKLFSPVAALAGCALRLITLQCTLRFRLTFFVCAVIIAILLLTLKALFDISLLHASLGSFIPVIDIDDILDSMRQVFRV
jgi:hypothetical protein